MTRPLLERAAGHRVPNIIPIAKAGSRRSFSDRIWQPRRELEPEGGSQRWRPVDTPFEAVHRLLVSVEISTVARAAEQIDPVINVSQFPGDRPLVGRTRPAAKFHGTDFWAQGLSFGLELSY